MNFFTEQETRLTFLILNFYFLSSFLSPAGFNRETLEQLYVSKKLLLNVSLYKYIK